MPDYKIVLTWESIYDVAEIAEYIEDKFSRQKADEFQRGIEKEFTKMVTNAKLYPGMIMECADFFSTLFLSLELGGDTNERALFDKNYRKVLNGIYYFTSKELDLIEYNNTKILLLTFILNGLIKILNSKVITFKK